MYLSSKEVRAKKTIHLPPKEEGVFLEILDKSGDWLFGGGITKVNESLSANYNIKLKIILVFIFINLLKL